MPSMSSCCMVCWLLSLHDECVGWVPGERYVPAGADGIGGVAIPVGGNHGQLPTRLGLDQVLDRDAKVAGDCYAPVNDVAHGCGRLGTGAVGRDRDLLWAHADSHGASIDMAEPVGRDEHPLALLGIERGHGPVAGTDGPVEQVRDAEEVR